MKNILSLLLLFSFSFSTIAQDFSAFEKKQFIRGNDTLNYRILYPAKYKKHKAYPLVMFLHGSGERGNDNEAQLVHGAKVFLEPKNRKYLESIVIFPQCPKNITWSKYKTSPERHWAAADSEGDAPIPQQLVKALMDSMIDNQYVNYRRVYLGGFSMGAFGTYDMLRRYPDFFAAAFPICGIADIPLLVQNAKEVPMWIFHGEKDPVVSPEPNRELYKALMTAGAKDVTYSEYPGVAHDSWTNAFAEPKLLPWLFSHKKKVSKK